VPWRTHAVHAHLRVSGHELEVIQCLRKVGVLAHSSMCVCVGQRSSSNLCDQRGAYRCVSVRACSCLFVRVRVCARVSVCAWAHAGSYERVPTHAWARGRDHGDGAFAIPNLRFEPVQVWLGRIDLCDVPPPLPELVDRNGPADKERDGGYDGRQAECDPHLQEGNGSSYAKAAISTTNTRQRTPTCIRACGGCTPGR
jgi:hypothetical protein